MTDEEKFAALAALVNANGQPNINTLWQLAKDLDTIKLNLKFFGYELAQRLASALPINTPTSPVKASLQCKPSTQKDLASDWVAYWCGQLQVPVVFHRKIWELAYVLQVLFDHGKIHRGARGLGFGCGEEPIPSLLASYGIDVLVTDLDPVQSAEFGWRDTKQHTSSLDVTFRPRLVTRAIFDQHVSLRYVDMNNIPRDLAGFDFCWSVCAFEHLGSIEKGMRFITESMHPLKPGGVSVHTTEFNFLNDEQTIDNWGTVLFQKAHFVEMKRQLEAQGHHVLPLDFDVGSDPLDKFIDLPPFRHDWKHSMAQAWSLHNNHIKVQVDGFPSTCFGLIAIKGKAG